MHSKLLSALAICAVGVGGLLVVILWLHGARHAAVHVPAAEPYLDLILGALVAAALLVIVFFLPIPGRERIALAVAWVAKAALALGPMLYYEAHYPNLDAYGYFRIATGAQAAGEAGDGTALTVFATRVVLAAIPDSFAAAKVVFAFVGLVGLYLIYRAYVSLGVPHRPGYLVLLACVPGILFWSSVLGKEPLMMVSLGIYMLGAARLMQGRVVSAAALLMAGAVSAGAIRIWMVPLLLVPLLVVAPVGRLPAWARVALLGAAGTMVALGGMVVLRYFSIGSSAELLALLNTISRGWAVGGSATAPPEFHTFLDAILFLPVGMFTALFRPLPGEVMNPFGILAGLESLMLLVLTGWAVLRLGRRLLFERALLWALAFIACWAAIYGFVSYQNLGTAVRFRLQVQPFLWFIILRAVTASRPMMPARPRGAADHVET